VMRATLPNITFSRESANDRFYIRMYDGSTPPNYSSFNGLVHQPAAEFLIGRLASESTEMEWDGCG